MEKLRFEIEVVAPVQTVWSTMLDEDTYRQWTGAFHEGSYYTGDWDAGSVIRFLGPDQNGSEGGMFGTIVENRPLEFVSVEYLGQIVGGEDDTTSEEALKFAGTHEDYTFSEKDGVTTVVVEIDSDEDYAEMFRDMWPKALDTLRDIAERADAPNRERLG